MLYLAQVSNVKFFLFRFLKNMLQDFLNFFLKKIAYIFLKKKSYLKICFLFMGQF